MTGEDKFRGWRVGLDKFTNYWQAVDQCKKSQDDISFDYHNSIFCNLKGLKIDLEYDYRSTYLKKLFDQPQNLLYSGGSDSHTILVLSERLGLQWEQIHTVLSAPTKDGEANWEYQPAINYCKTKNYNHNVINQDIEWYEKISNDATFMYKNAGEINFRPDYIQFAESFDTTKNYICGHEKPFLIYYQSRWYTWMQDVMLYDYIDCANIKYFFISPDMPEIYFQDARNCRNQFVQQNGLPANGTIVKERPSRFTLPNDRTKKSRFMMYNDKNASAIKQLWKMERADIIFNWLNIARNHYHNYKNDIVWENEFEHRSMLCWLIDIDSLESIDTKYFGDMLTDK